MTFKRTVGERKSTIAVDKDILEGKCRQLMEEQLKRRRVRKLREKSINGVWENLIRERVAIKTNECKK